MKYIRENRGQWIVDLAWPDGMRTRKVMPSESKANDISIRFQSARVDGTWRELRTKLDMESRPEALTFKELGNIYLDDYVKSYNRAYKSKESRIAILGRKLAQVQVSSLTPHHVTEFVSSRKRHGACNRTINRDLIVLGHMRRWAVRERYIQSNPLPEIQKLREIKWEGQRPSEEVVEAVLGKLDARVIPLFTFLRETGCRREEVLSLTHEQLDLGRGEVVLRDNTKNGKDRRVPLTQRALWAINAMPKASKYVFYHPDSLIRWDSCRKPWIKAREAAGHPWQRIHDLRHAFGIRWPSRGVRCISSPRSWGTIAWILLGESMRSSRRNRPPGQCFESWRAVKMAQIWHM